MTMTTQHVDTYPLDFNGYCTVAREMQRIRAGEVTEGDLLILDGYLSRVTGVNRMNLGTQVSEWPVLHITGAFNIVRFPHELVTVLRGDPSGGSGG